METNRKTILQRTTAKKIQAFLEGEERKALLVTGARQVGKTTLLRQLGQEAFPNFVELNFLENTAARQLFETATDSSDFLLRLSADVYKRQAMDQLRESYSALLFEQIIRVDSRLQNAQWENRPVLDYAGSARISKEYRALTKEILKRCV